MINDIACADASSSLTQSQRQLAALRKLLNSSLDVICSFDVNGCFATVSAAAFNLWGYRPEDVQGQHYQNFVHPDDLCTTRQGGRSLREGKQWTNFENRYLHKNGHIVPMIWSAWWDESDQMLYCVGRDARATKELEHRLNKTAGMFESFMENSPLAGWITNEQGVMQYMNSHYLRCYGFTRSDVGRSIYEMFPEEMATDYHLNNLRVLQHGKALETVEKAVLPCGEEQVLKIFKFPLNIDGLTFVGAWAVDITKQLEMQRQLEQSVERYHYVNEATSDAIYDWNIAKKTIYKGPAFESLFGYSQTQTSLRFRLRRIHPDDLSHYKKIVFSALRTGAKKWNVAFRFKDAKGLYRNVVDKAFVVYEAGRPSRVIGALQDVTEQKQLEKKLVEAERKIKRQVVKSIIETQEKERRSLSVELHDNVNQMLASCKLMLEFARENSEAAPMLTEKTYKSLQTVIDEIRRISHTLNPSVIEDVGLVEAVTQLVENVNVAGKLKVHFEAAVGAGEAFLEQDKIAIYRIIQEQINNILKHAQAQNIYITLVRKQKHVHLSIEDDGVGFNPTKVKKGLGLKNIHHRVDYYHGQVYLDAEDGKGCRLDVQLQLP